MAFKDIAGNSRVRKILRLALEKNRVPNSLLFCGPPGVGKRETALTLAKALNCRRQAADSCDSCPSCTAIQEGRFPDVMVVSREKRDLKIEQMRLIRQTAFLRPMSGAKRVFIIEEAEAMNEEAANSILKILEEPPLFSYIILLTENPFVILPTILSRCQVLQFTSIRKEEIETILVDKDFSLDQARIISLLVEGNLERALAMDWDGVEAGRNEAWRLFLSLAGAEEGSAYLERFVDVQGGMDEEEFKASLEIFSSCCRDLLLLKIGGDRGHLLNPDWEVGLRDLEKRCGRDLLFRWLARLEAALSGLPRNLNRGLLASSLFSTFEGCDHV